MGFNSVFKWVKSGQIHQLVQQNALQSGVSFAPAHKYGISSEDM